MKKPSIFLIAAVTCFSFTACKKDFLDQQPQDAVSRESYWKTTSDAVNAVNNCYRRLGDVDNRLFISCATDDSYSWSNWPSDVQYVGNGSATAGTGMFSNFWSNFYRMIASCNDVVENIHRVPAMDDSLRNRLIGEARFIRAFAYQQLIGLYGDVPLVTHIPTTDEFNISRTPRAQVADFIVKELDTISNFLPLSYPAADYGRATKVAALALKARTLLYEGKYPEAAAAAKAVMDLHVYSLYPDYYNLFQVEGDYSAEDVISYIHVKETKPNGLRDIAGINSVSGGTLYLDPLPSLVDDYESVNGYYPYTSDPAYDVHAPWKNRDPRLAATIFYPGSILPNNKVYDPINNTLDKINGDKATYTGYAFKKIFDKTDLEVRDNGGNDWKILRYAEVLLTYAEAANEATGPSAEVINALNEIRSRAHMPGVNETFALNNWVLNQASLRAFIRHERRIELAGEGHRYFDILRWKIGQQVLKEPVYTLDASQGLSDIDNTNGKTNKYPKTKLEERYFNSDKFYVWPVPQSILDQARNLQQQPEWK
jgi:hypothetical protein